jgi:hypothetical protein
MAKHRKVRVGEVPEPERPCARLTADACDILQHWHFHHTKHEISTFTNELCGPTADIYVVSSPELKRKFREFRDLVEASCAAVQ